MQSASNNMEAEVRPNTDATATSTTISGSPQVSQTNLQVSNGSPQPHEQLYRALSQYPFAGDSEYQAGLASILGHPETPVTQSEINSKQDLVLQAQCFYFSRKFNTPPINPAAYKGWLSTRKTDSSTADQPFEVSSALSSSSEPQSSTRSISQPQIQAQEQPQQSNPQAPAKASTPTTEEPPPYPTSFAAIVDLITNNKPIPGIEEIPTTVLEPGSSRQDRATRRKKPWETSASTIPVTAEEGTKLGLTAAASVGAGTDTINSPSANTTSETHGTTASSTVPMADTTDTLTSTPQLQFQPSIEKAKKTGEGVVKILQPNAIPDSGLIAKD